MSKYDSDAIDECCDQMLGHTNWSYADTGDLENIISERNGEIPKGQKIEHIVVFYKEA